MGRHTVPHDMYVEIEVDKVKLGYVGIHEKQTYGWDQKGKLIPVWDFYGSVSIRYREESGEEAGAGQRIARLSSDICCPTVCYSFLFQNAALVG